MLLSASAVDRSFRSHGLEPVKSAESGSGFKTLLRWSEKAVHAVKQFREENPVHR